MRLSLLPSASRRCCLQELYSLLDGVVALVPYMVNLLLSAFNSCDNARMPLVLVAFLRVPPQRQTKHGTINHFALLPSRQYNVSYNFYVSDSVGNIHLLPITMQCEFNRQGLIKNMGQARLPKLSTVISVVLSRYKHNNHNLLPVSGSSASSPPTTTIGGAT